MMITGIFVARLGDQDADRGSQGVGRGDRRDPEDRAAEQADRALCEPLVDQVGFGLVVRVVLLCVEAVVPSPSGRLTLRTRGSA